MKRFFFYLLVVMLVLAFSNSSQALFLCNPGDSAGTCCGADSGYQGYSWDLGSCDTLQVLPWPETDTCFFAGSDTICINTPGKNFPCFLHVPIVVTHDSNMFYWGGGGSWVQDSLSVFVVPLAWTRTNQSNYCSLATFWNQNIMDPADSKFSRSIWRHFHPSELDSNRMAWLAGQYQGLEWSSILKMTSDSSWHHSGGDSLFVPPHMWMALLPSSSTNRRWWEGERTLLATLTFRLADSMHICMDTTFWPPASRLAFGRYDARSYVSRDNLPLCIWGGPPILVTSPNGGETWRVGDNHDITWVSGNFAGANVNLEFSTNDGADWMTIIASTPNDGVHPWTIPDYPSSQCRVRVSDADDGAPYDISDNNFTIVRPTVAVTSPNGGEAWIVDSTYNITWSWNAVDRVKIEYSTNGGSSWLPIVGSTISDGSYSWEVPNTPSDSCRVRICDSDGAPCDTSDSNFSIASAIVTVTSPNGDEHWCAGSTELITWTFVYVTNVKIDYSTTGGSSWETIVASTPCDGEYSWDIPDSLLSTACKVKISDLDGIPSDISNSDFIIYKAGDVDGDGIINVADVIYLINYLFKYGPLPVPPEAGEVTSDGIINTADIIYLINYLFQGGPAPSC